MSNDLYNIINFADDHERKAFAFSLKSDNDIGGANLTNGAVTTSSGLSLPNDNSVCEWVAGSSDIAPNQESRFIDGSSFTAYFSGTEFFNVTSFYNLIAWRNAGFSAQTKLYIQNDGTNFGARIRISLATKGTAYTGASHVVVTGKSDFVKVQLVETHGYIYILIDDLLHIKAPSLNIDQSTLFNIISVGSMRGTNDSFAGLVKDFYGVAFPNLPYPQARLKNISICGDSLMQQGNYRDENYAPIVGSDTALQGSFYDAGATPTIQRKLTSLNKPAEVRCYAEGSTTWVTALTQVDGTGNSSGGNALDLNPAVIVIHLGTNDTNKPTLIDATYDASVQTFIDTIRSTNNKQHIVLCEIPTHNANPTFDTVAINANTEYANSAHAEIVSRNPNMTLCKLYDAFGGRNPNLSLFQTNDIHYSQAGSYLAGTLIAECINSVDL